MKKTMFRVAALMSLLAAVAFTACSEENDPNGQADASLSENDSTYTPPANLSSAEIAALIEEANAKLAKEDKVTVTYEDAEGNKKIIFGVHLSAQKAFDTWSNNTFQGDVMVSQSNGWVYYEGITEYRYTENSTMSSDIGKKERGQITDTPAFWDWLAKVTAGAFTPEKPSRSIWEVSGNAFVATADWLKEPCTYTVTLTTDKKYKTVKETYTYTGDIHEYAIAFSYGADILMLNGLDKSDFTPIEQYHLIVDWGNGLGVNTYWSEKVQNGRGVVYIEDRYSPTVAGKQPYFYTDVARTIPLENGNDYYSHYRSDSWDCSYYLTAATDGITLYAKWEDAPPVASAAAARVSPSATPNRLRLHWGLRTLNPAGSADCQPDRVECE
jgi:uncharacterized protein (DUF2147 family)